MTQRSRPMLLRNAALLLVGLVLSGGLVSAQTNPVKLVKGTITDTKSGHPIEGGRLNVYAGSSTELFAFSKVNPRTGAYQLILAPSTDYRFEVISPRYYTTAFSFRSPDGNGYSESVRDWKVEPIPIGTVLLSGHLFDAGSARLLSPPALGTTTDILKKQSAVVVLVTVYADLAAVVKKPAPVKKPKKGATPAVTVATPTPTADPAQALLNDRIAALKTYFKAQGISTDRLQFDGHTSATSAPTKGKLVDNVMIKINSIRTDRDNDED